MSPHDLETLLADYVDGTLPEDRLQELETALRGNPALSEEIELARFAKQNLKAIPQALVPLELADRIFDLTTRRPSLPERIAAWVRTVPAPAYALAMIAIVAGTLVFHQFGPTLKSPADLAAISHRGLPQRSLMPVTSGLPPESAVIDRDGSFMVVQKGPAVEVRIMTEKPEAPPTLLPSLGAPPRFKSRSASPMEATRGFGGLVAIGQGPASHAAGGRGQAPSAQASARAEEAEIYLTEPVAAPPPAPTVSAGGLAGRNVADEGPPIEEERAARVPSQAEEEREIREFFEGLPASAPAAKSAPVRKEGFRAQPGKSLAQEKKVEQAPSILQRFDGVYSGWTREGNLLISSPAALQSLWNKIWSTRLSPPQLPLVDFSRQVVLAVGMGTQPTGGFAVKINSAQLDGDTLTVHVSHRNPAEGSAVTESLTAPYSLIVLDLGRPVPAGLQVKFLEE